ncbi:MAG TPA: hypothetical protein VHN18_04155 [Micromonosporaceae bacterium]|nr:hypothetical protein [Micromonosporaceae bacterium]
MLRSMPAVLLVVTLLACLALPAAAGAQERQLEPTIIVDSATASATAPVASTTTLQAGQSYLLVVNNQYTETFPTVGGGTFTYFMDGVYCFDENPERPEFGCRTRPQVFERSGLMVRLGSPGDGSAENFRPFYTKLGNTTTPPPFMASHRYELRFTPPFGGRLLMAVTRDPNSTYSGTLGVELWGTPAPGDGSTGPSGSGPSPELQDLLNSDNCSVSLASPIGAPAGIGFVALPNQVGADICPARWRARGWNRPGPIPVLDAGDEAIVSSPELSPTQRTATVTLGTTAGDVVVTLSEDDARYRRFSRTACLLVAGRLARQDLVRSGILAANAKALIDAGDFLALSAIGKYLTACLAFVDDSLVGSARPVALPVRSGNDLRTRAAAAGVCPVSRVPVRLSASQATSLLHIDAKRVGAPPPTLRVTCRTTAAGMQVRVTPRRPGIGLRKLVGARLKVGLVRLPTSKQTAGPTISFRR